MGYCFVVCNCGACHATIVANPNHCPTLRINGVKEPICPGCFNVWNEIHRTSKGLEPIQLDPMAYEPEPEENL